MHMTGCGPRSPAAAQEAYAASSLAASGMGGAGEARAGWQGGRVVRTFRGARVAKEAAQTHHGHAL